MGFLLIPTIFSWIFDRLTVQLHFKSMSVEKFLLQLLISILHAYHTNISDRKICRSRTSSVRAALYCTWLFYSEDWKIWISLTYFYYLYRINLGHGWVTVIIKLLQWHIVTPPNIILLIPSREDLCYVNVKILIALNFIRLDTYSMWE